MKWLFPFTATPILISQVIGFRVLRFPVADGLDYSFIVGRNSDCGNAIACPLKGRWKFGLSQILSSDYAPKKPHHSGRAGICVAIRRDVQSCFHILMAPLRNHPHRLLPFKKVSSYCTKRQLLLLFPTVFIPNVPTETHGPLYEILLVFLNKGRKHSKLEVQHATDIHR
jgi:hypothetical protein